MDFCLHAQFVSALALFVDTVSVTVYLGFLAEAKLSGPAAKRHGRRQELSRYPVTLAQGNMNEHIKL